MLSFAQMAREKVKKKEKKSTDYQSPKFAKIYFRWLFVNVNTVKLMLVHTLFPIYTVIPFFSLPFALSVEPRMYQLYAAHIIVYKLLVLDRNI